MAEGSGSGDMPQRKCSPFWRQLYVVSGIVLNTIGTGCIIGYPAVLLPRLREPTSRIQVDRHSESWIAAIIGFAILNGMLTLPFIMDRCGRRIINFFSVLPALAGWGFIVLADSVSLLMLARYLQGFSMGLQGALGPISIGEYVSPSNRGGFLGSIALSLATGMLFCHTCGSYLTWQNAALANMSFSLLSLAVIATSPESPSWLASKGKFDKCRKEFIWLRGDGEKDMEELNILITKLIMMRNVKTKKPKDTFKTMLKKQMGTLKKKEFYRPLSIVLMMFILMQFSGANVIPTYSVTFMNAVTGDSVNSYTGMLVVDFVRFVAAAMSCYTLRRFKVRTVLFVSSIFSTIAVLATAAYLYFRDQGYIHLNHSWIPIISMLVYIFAMTSGIYVIPFGIMGEIFPLAYVKLGSCFGGIMLSFTFFAIIKSTPLMFITIGVHGVFVVFGGWIIFATSVLYFILPETRGKTLQQIEDHFKGYQMTTPEEGTLLKQNTEIEVNR